MNPVSRFHVLSALLLFVLGWPAPAAGQTIVGPLHFDVSPAQSEAITVTRDGHFLLVTSAVPGPDGGLRSSVPILLHLPGNGTAPIVEILAVDLGVGEITDVVAHPHGAWAVANIREDDVNPINQLVAFSGNAVVERVDLPARADGIALSPNGMLVAVASEGGEAIQIYSTGGAAIDLELAAHLDRAAMEPFFAGEEARIFDADGAPIDIEPESAKFSPDGSLLAVSLQEQGSIVLIDSASLEIAGVVHLPFGFEDTEGNIVGVAPDGFSFDPSGAMLIVANEADGDFRHLAGLSIIDLRAGPAAIPPPRTYCIFDIDPTLLDGTGLTSCPEAGPNGELPPEHGALPRLDPNNTATILRGGNLIAALNIERPPRDEAHGSVLFLDMNGVIDGATPQKITRINVGEVPRSGRPEGLATSDGGRYLWVALENDDGRIARFEILE